MRSSIKPALKVRPPGRIAELTLQRWRMELHKDAMAMVVRRCPVTPSDSICERVQVKKRRFSMISFVRYGNPKATRGSRRAPCFARAGGVSISFARAAGTGRARRFVSSLLDDVKYEKGEERTSLYFNALRQFLRPTTKFVA